MKLSELSIADLQVVEDRLRKIARIAKNMSWEDKHQENLTAAGEVAEEILDRIHQIEFKRVIKK